MFTNYFFAHNRRDHALMIPVYLAEMSSLNEGDPEIHKELILGNWLVNKNAQVPFCAGANNALKHEDCSMKVSGGLAGITLNKTALTKFFSDSFRAQLTATIERFMNPFSDAHTDLFNLVNKAVMPETVNKDLGKQSEIGQRLFDCFLKERVQSGKVNLWSPMKKRKLLTSKTTAKAVKVTAPDKIVELQEDRSLFASMMMVCKSRPQINIKETVGQYEFSIVS